MLPLSVTGGARIGWVSASWPLAHLSVSATELRLSCFLVGSYAFAPGQVVSFERYGLIPLLGRGIRVVHARRDAPRDIVFLSFRNPDRLVEDIHAAGFRPSAASDPVALPAGFPVKWSVMLAIAIVWNLSMLIGIGHGKPGIGIALAPAMIVALAGATKASPRVQAIVMRDGHRVEEIAPVLNLLLLVCGILAVAFAGLFFSGAFERMT